MTIHYIQDYGGIMNHAEYLAKGLKALGHEVDFVSLLPQFSTTQSNRPRKDMEEYRTVGTGYPYHQKRGWMGVPRVGYRDMYTRKKWLEKCSKYDAVLWHLPVPALTAPNKNVQEWVELYDHGSKNIAIIHDGNLRERNCHLLHVSDKFHAMVCVHESAMGSADVIDIPRKLIVNPFDFDLEQLENDIYGNSNFEQRSGFCAVQVFKGWKRVDTLIRAIPHMKNQEQKTLGGLGIEFRYMTSKDKCKPKYFEKGERIWDIALRHGMKHLGAVPNDNVYKLLQTAKVQIDPSFSDKYRKFGSHFNRTTIEAIINGTVPMATDWGMQDSKIFTPGENFIEIPKSSSPQQFAEIVDGALNDHVFWQRVRETNLQIIEQFHMVNVASEYVKLVTDPVNSLPKGTPDLTTQLNCVETLKYFNVEPKEVGVLQAEKQATLF